MQPLMRVLYAVEAECSDQEPKVIDRSVDEFTRIKMELTDQFVKLRDIIKQRDELDPSIDTEKYKIVKFSSDFRNLITQMRASANRMKALHRVQGRKKHKKLKNEDDADAVKADFEHRAEILALIFKHLDEAETLERRRAEAMNTPSIANVLTTDPTDFTDALNDTVVGVTGWNAKKALKSRSAALQIMPSAPPDLEIQSSIQELNEVNDELENELDEIKDSVLELKEVALRMGEELKLQSAIVEEVTHTVDAGIAQLNVINEKLSTTLDSVKSKGHIVVDLVLLFILLALGGYIYTLVTTPPAQEIVVPPPPPPPPPAAAAGTGSTTATGS
eukprot:TRINITY_DN10310_c0_g2_i1.p1 TRINITY_DN10310_c0_g2~~TRINITY_DN10310_c0_g2_i1.p1  ORF type:complete len:332 (+),score=100.87 TRINITY_DN10310_c0_g2_i1:384-1379(+)